MSEITQFDEQGSKQLMKQREVAAFFKCTTRTIRNWVKEERLPQHKVGKSVFYHRADVDRLAGFLSV